MFVVENENYWKNELSSLGIECKRKDEHNDKELATAVKEFYFQYYKTAYGSINTGIIEESQFD
jgi:hypothetical protein